MGSGASVIIGNRRLQIWVRAVHTETLSLLFEQGGLPSLHGTGSDSSHTFSFPCNHYRVALHGSGYTETAIRSAGWKALFKRGGGAFGI